MRKTWNTKNKRVNTLQLLLTLLLFLFLNVNAILAITIRDNFKYCNINNKNMGILDTNINCDIFNRQIKGYSNRTKDAFILTRLHNVVDGEGFECEMKKFTKFTEKTLFFYEHTDGMIENIKLNKLECENMVRSKKCNDYSMSCTGKKCSFTGVPIVEYTWLQRKQFVNYSCVITPTYISTPNLPDFLFGKNCLAIQGYCELEHNIIIWNPSEIIHKCPFIKSNVTKLTELYSNNTLIGYINYDFNWLFNIEYNTLGCECGINKALIKTLEGAYLYLRSTPNDDLPCVSERKSSLDLVTELILAENDFNKLQNFNERAKISQETCYTVRGWLEVYKFFDNRLFSLNFNENKLILYVKNNLIYVPQCMDLFEIELVTFSELCFKDIPCRFRKNNSTWSGFLTNEKIIVLSSINITCGGLRSVIQISDNQIIEYYNNKVSLLDSRKTYSNIVKLQFFDLSQPNFHHSPTITEGLDLIHDLKINSYTDSYGFNFNIEGKENLKEQHLDFDNLGTAYMRAKNRFYIELVFISGLIVNEGKRLYPFIY